MPLGGGTGVMILIRVKIQPLHQPWVRRSKPLPPNLKGSGAGEYSAFYDEIGHRAIDCRYLRRQLQELVKRGYLKKFIGGGTRVMILIRVKIRPLRQPWVRRSKPLPPNLKGLGVRKYYVFYDGMGHRTIDYRYLRRQL